jgi:transglutaminase-like putative cysteine protease
MILSIRHETIYRYTEPIGYSIQQLRMTPRTEPHQHTLHWNIAVAAPLHPLVDAFGNHSHMVTYTHPHTEIKIVVTGKVDIQAPVNGRIIDDGALSPLVFTVPTHLTQADEAIMELASGALRSSPRGEDMLKLAEIINDAVAYETGATVVTSTAAEALALQRGVCQDHAHLFLSCCHAVGIPARYVSGYIDTGSTQNAESHAWVDVWLEEDGQAGWVSIDVTHACYQNDRLCRLAIGRDYESAAPVRGVRLSGGTESLSVHVSVATSLNLYSQSQSRAPSQ